MDRIRDLIDEVAGDAALGELASIVVLLNESLERPGSRDLRELIVGRMMGLIDGRTPGYMSREEIDRIINPVKFQLWEKRRLQGTDKTNA